MKWMRSTVTPVGVWMGFGEELSELGDIVEFFFLDLKSKPNCKATWNFFPLSGGDCKFPSVCQTVKMLHEI